MSMISVEAIFFSLVCVINAYLSLFLDSLGYSATEIGILFGFFNFSAIALPVFLIPVISKKNNYSFWLIVFGFVLLASSIMLFRIQGFVLTAIVLFIFGGVYQCVIPVSDSLISSILGDKQEYYGMIRCSGTAGFIIMSIIMQPLVKMESITKNQMCFWMSLPCALFILSLFIREIYVKIQSNKKDKATNQVTSSKEATKDLSFMEALKSFGVEYYIVILVILLQFLGMVPSNMFISLYAQNQLNVNASGLLWAVGAATEFPFMFLSVWFIKKFGAKLLIFVCTAAVIVRIYLCVIFPNLAGCIASQALNAFTYGLFFPACVNYCTLKAKDSKKALMISMTLLSVTYGLAKVIGSPIGGALIDNAGYNTLFIVFSVFPVIGLLLYIPVKLLEKKSDK